MSANCHYHVLASYLLWEWICMLLRMLWDKHSLFSCDILLQETPSLSILALLCSFQWTRNTVKSWSAHSLNCHLPVCGHWKSLSMIIFGSCYSSFTYAVSESKSHRNFFNSWYFHRCTSFIIHHTFGFNVFNYSWCWRTYTDNDKMCSNFIRDVNYFHKRTKDLLTKFITCVPINSNSYNS